MTEKPDSSAAPNWPEEGNFVRSRVAHVDWARVHIAMRHISSESGEPYSVEMACGRWLLHCYLIPANGDQPRQCDKCWEAM